LADFTYAITVKVIKIQDTGKGTKSVAEDFGAVLRKIQEWHQGSISVQWFGSKALELTYKAPSGQVANELLYRHDKARLQSGVLSRRPQADCRRDRQAAGFHLSSRVSGYNK